MSFWIYAVALSAAVTLALAIPALRARGDAASRAEYDIQVYKDQLKELESEADAGRIRGDELEAARLEIQRRLLAAAEDVEARRAARDGARGRGLLILSAGAAPILGFVVYLQLGSPEVPDFPLASRTDLAAPRAAEAAPHEGGEGMTMADALAALEQRLQSDPDDIDGWILLARSYAGTGQPEDAARAYARAVPLSDRHPELLANWAEARLLARDGNFTEEIYDDFAEARKKDPTLPKPWFYIGLDKAMAGDLRGAVQIWTDLLTIAPADASFADAVRAQIAQAAEDGGFDPAGVRPSEAALEIAARVERATPPAAATAPAPGPTREQMEAAGEMSPEERTAFIRSMVDGLAARLEENPDDAAGWERLIRAYRVLGETDKAAAAQQRLDALTGN